MKRYHDLDNVERLQVARYIPTKRPKRHEKEVHDVMSPRDTHARRNLHYGAASGFKTNAQLALDECVTHQDMGSSVVGG